MRHSTRRSSCGKHSAADLQATASAADPSRNRCLEGSVNRHSRLDPLTKGDMTEPVKKEWENQLCITVT